VKEPVVGRRLRSASDQCPGTVQWTDPGHARMGVRWDDGTTSAEHMGGVSDVAWEWAEGAGHVCAKPWCLCPEDGEWLYYAPAWGEHACPRVDCRYAHGPGPGGGWVGTPPPTWEPGS
jgi:hypothetical protein